MAGVWSLPLPNHLPRSKEDIDLLTNARRGKLEQVAITPNNFAYLKRPVEAPPPQKAAQAARTARRNVSISAK